MMSMSTKIYKTYEVNERTELINKGAIMSISTKSVHFKCCIAGEC